jgi:replicative DNA helicase
MSAQEIQLRQLAGHCQINLSRIRSGELSDADWEEVIRGANRIANVPISFYDKGTIAVEDLANVATTFHRRRGAGIVIIDYLQLLSTKARTSTRNEELGKISGKLKQLARDLGIPVVALSQLNRKCEDEKRRPNMRDLRESGNIEQDADIIGFIYRDHVYNQHSPEHEADLILAKGRNIQIGTIKMYWDGQHQTFRDLSKMEGYH